MIELTIGSFCSRIAWDTRLSCVLFLLVFGLSLQAVDAQDPVVKGVKGGVGQIKFDISDVVGRPLASKVVIQQSGSLVPVVIELPEGVGSVPCAPGTALVKVYIYDEGVPVLVDIKDVEVEANARSYVLVSLLEASKEAGPLRIFDQDFDLALDSFELAYGTDPLDAASIPGERAFGWESKTLKAEPGWYRGELHASSRYGTGEESVAELVKRAEKLGLDFLAITDRNTMEAALDPEFTSDKVVLIPAMEWGNDERGVALVYGPQTPVPMTQNVSEAQAMFIRVQAQGGMVAIAHPCFPTNPWQWGFSHMNAVEGWCRSWGEVPPMTLRDLDAHHLERKDGKLIHSIAESAATKNKSANGQAVLFMDLEIKRGLRAGIIAGSRTASPKVPMASPITYVYAVEKSLKGILQGLRQGHTFVSSGPDGPHIDFTVDVYDDNSIDVAIGGVIPINQPSRFYIYVKGAKGKHLELLRNGIQSRRHAIEEDEAVYSFIEKPGAVGAYRARIVDTPAEWVFEMLEVHAMTSPIYARQFVVVDPVTGQSPWIPLKNEYVDPRILEERIRRFGDPAATELKLGVKRTDLDQ